MTVMNTQNKKLKTVLVLTAVIGLQLSTLFAGSIGTEISGAAIRPPETVVNLKLLAPITPLEADFEEETIQPKAFATDTLAPVTPAAADFDDQD